VNVQSLAVAEDRAVITLVNGRELTITRAWLADQFAHAAGRSAGEKRDAVLAAVRATFVDAERLAPERLWVDFEEDGTIRGVVLTREKDCPFDNERWEHHKKA
jgi:F420-0:gamma-glutamyl ligase